MQTTSLKIMTYEEWLAANPDVEQSEGCKDCKGNINGNARCLDCGAPNIARAQYQGQRRHDEALLKKYQAWLEGGSHATDRPETH